MEIEYKWTIEDDVLKESFGKLGIDDKFFPVFKERALYRLNDIVLEELMPEDIDDSIESTSKYIKEYANQIKKGMSKVYAHAYAYAVNMEFQEVYCIIFAEAYEVAIAHGQNKSEAFCFGDFCSKAADQGFFYVLKILSNVSMKIGRRTSILTLYANNLSKRIITRCQKVNINFIKGSYINNIYNPSIILY